MRNRAFLAVSAGIVGLALVACGGRSGAPSGIWGPALTPSITNPPPAAEFAPDSTFNVSGTYDGSVHVSENGKSYTGSLVVVLTQKGDDLSGSVTVTHNGRTAHLTIEDGTVKIEGKKKAALAFKLYDPKGQYAAASATVKGKKLTGKGTAGKASISFSAKKTKK